MAKLPMLDEHNKAYIRREKRLIDEARRLLNKGILDARLRKALTAAGLPQTVVRDIEYPADVKVAEELLNHEWERLHDHMRANFDQKQVDKIFDELR